MITSEPSPCSRSCQLNCDSQSGPTSKHLTTKPASIPSVVSLMLRSRQNPRSILSDPHQMAIFLELFPAPYTDIMRIRLPCRLIQIILSSTRAMGQEMLSLRSSASLSHSQHNRIPNSNPSPGQIPLFKIRHLTFNIIQLNNHKRY
jgi:hypothetical protein